MRAVLRDELRNEEFCYINGRLIDPADLTLPRCECGEQVEQPGERCMECKVDYAKWLINNILEQRDELAKVLGLQAIDLRLDIFEFTNPDADMDDVSYIFSQAIDMNMHDNYLYAKRCTITKEGRKSTHIYDHGKLLGISVGHK